MQFNLSNFGLKVDVKRMLVDFSSHLNACLKIEEFATLSLSRPHKSAKRKKYSFRNSNFEDFFLQKLFNTCKRATKNFNLEKSHNS